MNLLRAKLFWHWFEIHRDLDYWQWSRREMIWKNFQSICDKYSEPHRHYHTMVHLLKTLEFVDKHARNNEASRYKAIVKLALFYHDIVYDVQRKDNEDLSQIVFGYYSIAMNFPKWLDEQVRELILLTKSHKLPPGAPVSHQLMNDADMSIFLADSETYLEYAQNIWREYSWVGKEVFVENRLKFLDSVDASTMFYLSRSQSVIARADANIELERLTLLYKPERILV